MWTGSSGAVGRVIGTGSLIGTRYDYTGMTLSQSVLDTAVLESDSPRDAQPQLGRVSTFIQEHSPHIFCPRCIAHALSMNELVVREKLQVVVGHPASQPYFGLTRRLCYGCCVMGDHVGLRR